MKRKSHAGSTSNSLPIFVQNTASGAGAGLGGLVFNTAGLVAEYRRQGQSGWTAITLAAGTLGTFVSGGFVADGALPGAYEFCPPDTAYASGRWVAVRLYGALNMLPVLAEIELDAVDYQDGSAFGLSRLDATVSSRSSYAGGAVASVAAPVTVGTNNDKSGYLLGPTGLDAIPITDPGGVAGQTTFPKQLVALYRRFYGKVTKTATQIKTFGNDETTVNTTQAVSDDGAGNQSQGAAT